MLLYHYTAAVHLPSILGSGVLWTTESNVSFKREHAGRDVVWLTTAETTELGHGLQASSADKTEIRFTVELPKRAVHRWKTWAKAQGSNAEAMTRLARAGGAGTWWVTMSEIPSSAWREVHNMRADIVLLDAKTIEETAAEAAAAELEYLAEKLAPDRAE